MRSRRHSRYAAIRHLCKELGEFVAAPLVLTENEVASRFEADKLSARDALRRAFTRLVRGELVVFRMSDQGGHADRLEIVVIHICVRNECVEDETGGAHGEQSVDERVDVPDVIAGHREPLRNRRDETSHR